MSELTAQPIPIVMRISLLIKTNHPDQSIPKYYTPDKGNGFQQNLLEKVNFIAKMSGPAGYLRLLENALKFIKDNKMVDDNWTVLPPKIFFKKRRP